MLTACEKFEVILICIATKPRNISKNNGSDHGFDYRHNEKAQMTSELFLIICSGLTLTLHGQVAEELSGHVNFETIPDLFR